MLSRVLTDAHSHVPNVSVLEVIEKFKIHTLACGTEPSECSQLRLWSETSRYLIPTYGLHPWKADRFPLTAMLPYLETCRVIGEIGLDSRWARSDPSAQRSAFLAQLDIAERRGVPVILHTSGQEAIVGNLISHYSMPVCVHWYDCPDHLDLYTQRGCYFTVGEAVFAAPDVRRLAGEVPIDRLLVETDGIDAIRWLRRRSDVPAEEIPRSLRATLAEVARIRKVAVEDMARIVNENFFRFIRQSPAR
jgi:TatD DNase family protein